MRSSIANLKSTAKAGRLVWVFGVGLGLLTLIAGGLGIWDTHRRTIEEANGDMRNLGIVLAEQSARYFQVIDLLLQEIQMRSRDLNVSDQERFRHDLGGEDMHRFLSERLKNLPQARATGLFDANGDIVSTSHDDPIPRFNAADRDYFEDVRNHAEDKLFVSIPAQDRRTGLTSFFLARRINGPDGRFLGAAVASINIDYLLDFYQAIGQDRHIGVTLIRRDGITLARFPQRTTIGQPIPTTSPWYALVAAGGGSYHASGYLTDAQTIVAVNPLRDYDLVIDVSVHESDVLATWRGQAGYMAGAVATLAGALIGLFWMIANQMRRQEEHSAALSGIADALLASEKRLRDFAELASDWYWEQDADLKFIEISAGTPLLAPDDRSHLGKMRWDINDTSRDPERWDMHRQVVQGHQRFLDFRYDRQGPDGCVHHVSISGVPVYNGSNVFIGYRGIGRDITAQIETEQALHRAKERAEQIQVLLRDAVDSISEGFVIYDDQDRFVMCNEAYRQIYSEGVDLMVPGVPFEDIVRHVRAKGGGNADWQGREDEGLAVRVQHRREALGSIEHRLANGSWILVTDRRMKSGGIAGLRVNITDLKQTKAALAQSEERLERAQAIAGIGSWELDVATGNYIWSKEMYRIRGLSPTDFQPNICNLAPYVHPDDDKAVKIWISELSDGIGQNTHETRIVRPNGEVRMLSIESRTVTDADGVVSHLAGTAQDITERRLIEQQLAQAQKMEAIGNLTGGMAHDFNNGLGVIIGNLDLLGRLIKTDPMATELCAEANDGAHRCAELIRLLLAFARRQSLHPKHTDVNALVQRTIKLLGRLPSAGTSVTLDLCPELAPAIADPTQLEAALINLVNNARDAMPRGGVLSIRTRPIELDEHYAALHPETKPGRYLLIEVSDTGDGIPPNIISRIFEPFFTTKELGRGSGLGLSMVFGFVKQSGGHLAVYSEPGLGTTFRIYLPFAQIEGVHRATPAEPLQLVGGTERILMVEDNIPLRRTSARRLAELGYEVLEAGDAAAALAILSGPDPVDILFTDIVMPGKMDGFELACEAMRMRRGLTVLLATGFPGVRGADPRMANSPFPLLNKPYSHDQMARSLRESLDRVVHPDFVTDYVASTKMGI